MPPPIAPAAAVSADIRLHYVLHHFRQAYAEVPPASIGYAGRSARIEVADASAGFFAQQQPYPPAPTLREWQGWQLPFFFDSHPEKPLLELLPDGRAHIHFDLISAAFYLLSGWQEYFSDERDRYGRFPYAASVQQRYGFVAVPVVNYYFDVLKTAVEHATGQTLRPRRWAAEAPFATFVTHDVDLLTGAWKAPVKVALQQRRWPHLGRLLWEHFTLPDAWNNLEQVEAETAALGGKSTFFFLANPRPTAGTPNANYDLSDPDRQREIQALDATWAEIAVHGSIGTSTSAEKLRHERAKLPVESHGNRFHYLYWDPRRTPTVVDEAGFAYDSTLGFAEHFGFRNSYCLPFQPYNFALGDYCRFLEIPLNVMDATLHHPRYLQLAPEEILPALQPMFEEIERFGGVCTLLWHNDHFDPDNRTTGPRQFAELMHYLRSRNSAFVNGRDICEGMKA